VGGGVAPWTFSKYSSEYWSNPVGQGTFECGLFTAFAAVAKAIGSPQRFALLDLVAQAERPMDWLAQATGMTVANTSQHLQILRAAGLVERRRDGLYVRYRLAGPSVSRLVEAVRAVAEERDAEVERLVRTFLGDRSEITVLSIDELLARMSAGDVVVLDVRPREEFETLHVAGARSAPLAELPERFAALPRDRTVVAYCRGPYCLFAEDAVRLLLARGFDVARLAVGLPEWRAAGHPVQAGGEV